MTRRFLLLLLAFLLPLQMSWAAAQLCDDEGAGAGAIAAHAQASHDDAGGELADTAADAIADACCEAAHGCNGLHHLMGQADPQFPFIAANHRPAPSGAAPPQPGPPDRIERPNWPAA